MKSFVVPPRPLPTKLLGQQPKEFYFTDRTGQRIGSEQLAGKIAVLAWYHDNPACEATLQQVSLARERLGDEADAVRFYAVATDPTFGQRRRSGAEAGRLEGQAADRPRLGSLWRQGVPD